MNFATELVKLLPRKFRIQTVWQELFEAFGELLDAVHDKIDGIPDLTDPESVPVEYVQYLARNMGVPLPSTFGTVEEYRKRWFLRSIPWIIQNKGTGTLIGDLARFLFFFTFPTAQMEVYEQWTTDYVNFFYPPLDFNEVPAGWVGDDATTAFGPATISSPPIRIRSIHITTTGVGDVPLEVWDNGDGVLKGDVAAGSSVDRTTGELTIVFTTPPKSGESINVSYTQEAGQYLSPHYLLAFPTNIYLEMGLDSVDPFVPNEFWSSAETGPGVVQFEATYPDVPKLPIKEGSVVVTAFVDGEYRDATDADEDGLLYATGLSPFLDQIVTSEIPSGWQGDGIETAFETTSIYKALEPSQVQITTLDTGSLGMTLTDDGAGNLTGDGTGTVNYETGTLSITFSNPVKSGENITLQYRHPSQINYETGKVIIRYAFAPAAGTDVTLAYDYKNIYLGRKRVDEMVAYLDRYRPAHTVYEIGLGTSLDFWRVGNEQVGDDPPTIGQRNRVGDYNGVAPTPANDKIIRVGEPAWL